MNSAHQESSRIKTERCAKALKNTPVFALLLSCTYAFYFSPCLFKWWYFSFDKSGQCQPAILVQKDVSEREIRIAQREISTKISLQIHLSLQKLTELLFKNTACQPTGTSKVFNTYWEFTKIYYNKLILYCRFMWTNGWLTYDVLQKSSYILYFLKLVIIADFEMLREVYYFTEVQRIAQVFMKYLCRANNIFFKVCSNENEKRKPETYFKHNIILKTMGVGIFYIRDCGGDYIQRGVISEEDFNAITYVHKSHMRRPQPCTGFIRIFTLLSSACHVPMPAHTEVEVGGGEVGVWMYSILYGDLVCQK